MGARLALLGLALSFCTLKEADDMITKKQGWSKTGTLTCGVTTDKVSMQADFATSDPSDPDKRVAGIYTVQFGVTPPASGIFSAVATVTWTVEGNPVTRQFNFANGTTISGPGQHVAVSISDTSASAPIFTQADGTKVASTALAFVPGQTYGVTINVVPGSRPTTEQTPYYTAFPTAWALTGTGTPASSGVFVPVPQNIGVISAQVLAQGGDTTSVAQLTVTQFTSIAAGQTLLSYTLGLFPDDHVPIVPGAALLFIQNLTTGLTPLQVVFGIDG